MTVSTDISLIGSLKKYFGFDTFKGNQEEIIRLLNTPNGRRDDWNNKKP